MTANVQGTLGSRGYFFLNNIDGSGRSAERILHLGIFIKP